jgi:hypothetical protein
VFLNATYLAAHMDRRHADVRGSVGQRQTVELERELERIKERLRITEMDLTIERNARLGGASSMYQQSTSPPTHAHSPDPSHQAKSREIRRLQDELERSRDALKHIDELNAKNFNFELTIKDLQERLGKQSNVGWMKDDVDLEKDTVLNQIKEIQRLKESVRIFFTTLVI